MLFRVILCYLFSNFSVFSSIEFVNSGREFPCVLLLWLCKCRLNDVFDINFLEHRFSLHAYGLSPVCKRMMCIRIGELCVNVCVQNLHLKVKNELNDMTIVKTVQFLGLLVWTNTGMQSSVVVQGIWTVKCFSTCLAYVLLLAGMACFVQL